jgi:hypothetical protein
MSGGVTTATGEPGWVGAFASAGPANGLYTGGAFASAGGTPSEMVARWGCGCYPDCTGDGALTVADFGCFQTKFAAANPYTDCTGDGALTVADFGCFQSAFVAGCP